VFYLVIRKLAVARRRDAVASAALNQAVEPQS